MKFASPLIARQHDSSEKYAINVLCVRELTIRKENTFYTMDRDYAKSHLRHAHSNNKHSDFTHHEAV